MVERILNLMKENEVNGVDLAKAVGLSHGAVSEWKTGRNMPRSEAIAKIAKHFGVSSDYLLGLTSEKEPHYKILDTKKKELQVKHLNEFEGVSMNEKAREAFCELQPMFSMVLDIINTEKYDPEVKKAAKEYLKNKNIAHDTILKWSRYRYSNIPDVTEFEYILDGLENGFGGHEIGYVDNDYKRHIADYEYYLSSEDSTNALLDRVMQLETAIGLAKVNDL